MSLQHLRYTARLLAREGLGPVAAGLCAGLGGAAALSRLVSSLLSNVRPLDPAAFGGVCLLLFGVAAAAVSLSAVRAARVTLHPRCGGRREPAEFRRVRWCTNEGEEEEQQMESSMKCKAWGVCVVRAIVASALLLGVASQAQQQAPSVSDLKAQFEEASRSGDPAKAAVAAERLVSATEGEHVEALYQAARLHARLGHREQAYLLLARAVGAGFDNRDRLLEDEAFTAFRNEDLFRAMARKAWARGYTNLLERANREQVQKSPEIMKALAFKPGERVADIGAGTGYFTFQVADAVGPTGRVEALDIAPEMLEYLDMRIKARKAGNVTTRRVVTDDPQLPPGSADTIVMVDAIHYVKDRSAYAKKLAAGLAPGGRLVVIDYKPKPMSERPWGPPPEQQFPKEQLDKEMSAAGFLPVASFDFLPEQFFVVYQLRSRQTPEPWGPPEHG